MAAPFRRANRRPRSKEKPPEGGFRSPDLPGRSRIYGSIPIGNAISIGWLHFATKRGRDFSQRILISVGDATMYLVAEMVSRRAAARVINEVRNASSIGVAVEAYTAIVPNEDYV